MKAFSELRPSWPKPEAVAGCARNALPATKEMLHDAFGLLHTVTAYLLYALVTLHIAGALKHQFMDKEAELQRMWL